MKTDLNKIQYNIVRAVLVLIIIGLSFDIFIIINDLMGNTEITKQLTGFFYKN
jgi:hypothetical protein